MLLVLALAAQMHALPDLRSAVTRNDSSAIVEAKRRWEQGWEQQWHLVNAELKEIDHFKPGIVLEWRGTFGQETRSRTDAFTLDGDFYWAFERIERDGRPVARGSVELSPDGIRRYRNLALLAADDEIEGYELHVFTEGKAGSIYRAKRNFGKDGDGQVMLPPDAKLVAGPPVPELEARRPREK